MSMWAEIRSVTAINLRSLPQRVGTSLVVVVGIGGVVAVLISMLSLATGLSKTLASTGRNERVIVLNRGAQSEVVSSIARNALFTISDAPGIKRDVNGKPLITGDVVLSAWLPKTNGSRGSVALRGMGPNAMSVRPEIKIIEGRNYEAGKREIIAGQSATTRFRGLHTGDVVASGDAQWTVVGVFTSDGDAHESELLADADTLLSAANRTVFNSITLWLDTPESFDSVKDFITTNPLLTLDVEREVSYYERQSNRFGSFLTTASKVVAVVMAIGAVFGALNTMYSAVSTRTVEIATLRALGFGATGVVISVLTEAVLLALIGALLGSALAWIAFNGNSVSTISGSSGLAQVAFHLRIGFDLVALGIVWACVVGLIGGLMPAIRAARVPVATALRQT